MPQKPMNESPRHVQSRLEAFWDCLARLLAKRWLREEGQMEESVEEDVQNDVNEEPQ